MRKNVWKGVMAVAALFVLVFPLTAFVANQATAAPLPIPPGTIDPATIPKFVNQLTGPPPAYVPTVWVNTTTGKTEHNYTVTMSQFSQQILPNVVNPLTGLPFPTTTVWGYGGQAKDSVTGAPMGFVANSPAPSFEALRGVPINVKWINQLTGNHMFAVDPTLHWADPNNLGMVMPDMNTGQFLAFPPGYAQAQSNVPVIPHVHGLEVQSTSDGNPEAWWTATGTKGSAYNTYVPTDTNAAVFDYPNAQPAATLWYHDHALGITRINVLSGLAGFYLLRDPLNDTTVAPLLPSGQYEVPLAIQDRTFKTNGDFWFDTVGINPTLHPYWMPEFFGNTIMVNGQVWPNMNVDHGQYRFRVLDGSNARFYTFSFWVPATGQRLPFTVIGAEGGYLRSPATVTQFTIAPGERADILVDFSALPTGTKVILDNKAKAPFPAGASPDPQTTGRLMQFTVTANPGFAANVLPTVTNPDLTTYPSLTVTATTNVRTMVLTEIMGPLGPAEILLNGMKWAATLSETPSQGSTEVWQIVNPTADTHPIHLHLVTFQVVSRQKMDTMKYYNNWVMAQTDTNAMPPWSLSYTPTMQPIGPYLKGKSAPAPLFEQGWKDTVKVNPGEVAIIVVRWAPIDGSGSYPFDPKSGPGYVWHCHIIDHEDNEMMRPYTVV